MPLISNDPSSPAPAWIKIAAVGFLINSAFAQAPSDLRLWPAPPEKARIEYLYSISSQADLGIKKSLLRKIWDFILGAADEEQRISQPTGVAADGRGRIYVADAGAKCVHVFDRDEKSYAKITKTLSGSLIWPIGLALSSDGSLFVSDAMGKEVVVFDREGNPVRSISGRFERPTGLAIKGDRLFVVDTPLHKILVFDLQGRFLYEFGKRGSAGGEFNYPVHVAARNSLYVIDAMNHRVQVLSDSGSVLSAFGTPGNTRGTFANPKGIAVDSEDHIYVTDVLFDAIQIFDDAGLLLLVIGKSGNGVAEFLSPGGMYIDSSDIIYVVDSLNRRVQVFRYLK